MIKEIRTELRIVKFRMNKLPAISIVSYFWSAIVGTDNSINMYNKLKKCNAKTFEDKLDDFRSKFNDDFFRGE